MDPMDPGSIQPPVFDYPALEELDPSLGALNEHRLGHFH